MSNEKQPKVTVGQRLFITNYSSTPTEGKYFTVNKVGRKYFEVEGLRRKRFLVEDNTDASTGVSSGARRAVIHPSKEEYEHVVKVSKLRNAICRSVREHGLKDVPLEQLEQIALFIGIETD